MAQLQFNLLGLYHQQGVDLLEKGFALSAAALREEQTKIRHDLEAYEAHVANGGEPIGEWENGHSLWEQNDVLSMQIEETDESLMDLRKAYVLAAYHHWERGARRWTRAGSHAKHPNLVISTRKLGYPIDARLVRVYDLVNTLKHNSATWAEKLAVGWPDILKVGPGDPADQDWYNAVELEDRHVYEVCDIVRDSGPSVGILPLTP